MQNDTIIGFPICAIRFVYKLVILGGYKQNLGYVLGKIK